MKKDIFMKFPVNALLVLPQYQIPLSDSPICIPPFTT